MTSLLSRDHDLLLGLPATMPNTLCSKTIFKTNFSLNLYLE